MNEVEDIKVLLKKIEEYKKIYNNTIEDFDDRLHKTLFNYQTSVDNFHKVIKELYELSGSDEVRKFLDLKIKDLDKAYKAYEEIRTIWPELFQPSEEELNDTKDA